MNGDCIIILLIIAITALVVLTAKVSSFLKRFAEKTCKGSLIPLLLPSVFGICICMICICGMTLAWYSASVQAPTQRLTAAYYAVAVESVTNGETEIKPDGDSYLFEAENTYTVKLRASGSVKECSGYCLIEKKEADIKVYTQTFEPGASIVIQFQPSESGAYTFTGVWGSLPMGTTGYLENFNSDIVGMPNDASVAEQPTVDSPVTTDGTYFVQPGDTLSEIAEKYNTTAEKLAAYNGIADIGAVKAGQLLDIPPQDYEIPVPPEPDETIPIETEGQTVPEELATEPVIESSETYDPPIQEETIGTEPAVSVEEETTN